MSGNLLSSKNLHQESWKNNHLIFNNNIFPFLVHLLYDTPNSHEPLLRGMFAFKFSCGQLLLRSRGERAEKKKKDEEREEVKRREKPSDRQQYGLKGSSSMTKKYIHC